MRPRRAAILCACAFFARVWIGLALSMSSCGGQEPAGTPNDASADAYVSEDASADETLLDTNPATDVNGTPPVDGWPELDVPTDFDVTDGDGSDAPALDDATSDGSGTCPSTSTSDSCALCPGVACQLGAECNSTYHQGGPASTHCICVNGRMQCCFQVFPNGALTYTEVRLRDSSAARFVRRATLESVRRAAPTCSFAAFRLVVSSGLRGPTATGCAGPQRGLSPVTVRPRRTAHQGSQPAFARSREPSIRAHATIKTIRAARRGVATAPGRSASGGGAQRCAVRCRR